MNIDEFFDESRIQSQVKASIVSDYFPLWANIIKKYAKQGRIAYIELFAGSGRYNDGTASTPSMVLQKAILKQELAEMLVSIFVEKEKDYCNSLISEIRSLDGIDLLKHAPQIINKEIDKQIIKIFDKNWPPGPLPVFLGQRNELNYVYEKQA